MGSKETELGSSYEVFFLFQRGSLGHPELVVQLLHFFSKASEPEDNAFTLCSCNPVLGRRATN